MAVTATVVQFVNPLSEQDYATLQQAQARHAQVQQVVDRCEACGINVADRQQTQANHQQGIALLMKHFFQASQQSVPSETE